MKRTDKLLDGVTNNTKLSESEVIGSTVCCSPQPTESRLAVQEPCCSSTSSDVPCCDASKSKELVSDTTTCC